MGAVFLLWSLLLSAHARTVAVLPLEPGAKTEKHDGLGMALAGMLMTDLVQVPSLTVVERSRLDALLQEIKLGESGYLDPKTAAKFGRGVGAEWVITGSWSVIEPAFLLDLRAIEVSSGVVLAASNASGSTTDFVSVEKDAIADLLDLLKVELERSTQRKMLGTAPTESFKAIAAYGAGLQAEQDAQYDEARKHFEASSNADPAFDLPRQRTAKLRTMVNAKREQRREASATAKDQMFAAALAKTPDEMSLKKPSTTDEWAQLRLRWTILANYNKYCQITQEMVHALERHQGKLPGSDNEAIHKQAYAIGAYPTPPRQASQGHWYGPRGPMDDLMLRRVGGSSYHLVIGNLNGISDAVRRGKSLVESTVKCSGKRPQDWVDAIVELRRLVKRLGIEDLSPHANRKITMAHELEILELDARVMIEGMSERVAKRLGKLMTYDLGPDANSSLHSDVGMVTRNAELAETLLRLQAGLDWDTAHEWVEAAHQKRPPAQFETPACSNMKDHTFSELERFDEAFKGGPITFRRYGQAKSLMTVAQKLRLLGCIQGQGGELNTTAKALAWLDTMDQRRVAGPERSKCDERFAKFTKDIERYREAHPQPEFYARHAVDQGLSFISRGCARL